MFGLRNKTPEPVSDVPAGPLDRIGRRSVADARPDGAPQSAPVDRQARLAEAAASLAGVVGPRLRSLVTSRHAGRRGDASGGPAGPESISAATASCCRRSSCAATSPTFCAPSCRRPLSPRPSRQPRPSSLRSPPRPSRKSGGSGTADLDRQRPGNAPAAAQSSIRPRAPTLPTNRAADCRAARSTRRGGRSSRCS